MNPSVQIYLFGSLTIKGENEEPAPVTLGLDAPRPLMEVLELLGIKPDQVSLAMVNHKSVPADWPVRPGDRLSLFPREYPIFADWRDHRLNVAKG
jgi:hypothetical protein